MKSEPSTYSIEDLKRDGFTGWDGVRNYQARNYMRDKMQVGDFVLFYHSNAKPPGVAGVARVSETDLPDWTALDPDSPYFDPKSTPDDPRWIMVELEFVEEFPKFIPLSELRNQKSLSDMPLLQKGSRLSVMPIKKRHFQLIKKMAS